MSSYCTTDELARFGIRSDALRGIDVDDQQGAIDSASAEIDSYIGSQYTLPLVAWESDLRRACAKMAVCDLLMVRGVNSAHPNDDRLFEDRQEVVKWLTKIANGDLSPRFTDSSSGAQVGRQSGSVQVSSNCSRGYSTASGDRLPFTGGGRR